MIEPTRCLLQSHFHQTADGRVYALAGRACRFSGETGSTAAMTQTLTQQTLTETQKGETQTRSFECAIKAQLAARPERATLFWMDAENGVCSGASEYAAGTLPETKLRAEDADSLAVETAVDGTAVAHLYGPEQVHGDSGNAVRRRRLSRAMQYTQLNGRRRKSIKTKTPACFGNQAGVLSCCGVAIKERLAAAVDADLVDHGVRPMLDEEGGDLRDILRHHILAGQTGPRNTHHVGKHAAGLIRWTRIPHGDLKRRETS